MRLRFFTLLLVLLGGLLVVDFGIWGLVLICGGLLCGVCFGFGGFATWLVISWVVWLWWFRRFGCSFLLCLLD